MKNIIRWIKLLFGKNVTISNEKSIVFKSGGNGPIPPLTKKQIRSLLITLTDMSSITPKIRQLEDDQFQSITNQIRTVINHFHPSGSNNTCNAMNKAIMFIFEQHNVTSKQYWEDVWRRSRCKDCFDYNSSGNATC